MLVELHTSTTLALTQSRFFTPIRFSKTFHIYIHEKVPLTCNDRDITEKAFLLNNKIVKHILDTIIAP